MNLHAGPCEPIFDYDLVTDEVRRLLAPLVLSNPDPKNPRFTCFSDPRLRGIEGVGWLHRDVVEEMLIANRFVEGR